MYASLGGSFVLASALRAGIERLYGLSTVVPIDQKFYIGGPDVMRGFYPKTLGPDSTGGTVYLAWNVAELRFPIYKWFGGDVFFDMGNLWNFQGKSFSDYGSLLSKPGLRYNAGGGLRVHLPIFILSLDVGINYRGYFSDAAVTIPVGKVSPRVKKLLQVARESLNEGIKRAREDNHLFDISSAIQNHVEKNGFSVVREFVGHGIGLKLHEEPEIPNFGRKGFGPLLLKGMVLAIEPMVNMGSWEAQILDNGWTAVTKDGLPSAHFEHTVAITQNGPKVLTI